MSSPERRSPSLRLKPNEHMERLPAMASYAVQADAAVFTPNRYTSLIRMPDADLRRNRGPGTWHLMNTSRTPASRALPGAPIRPSAMTTGYTWADG